MPAGYLADASDPAVTSLAADFGLTIGEARARIGWQEAAIELHDRLVTDDAEHFGGLWIDQADGGRVKIGAVGDATKINTVVQAAGIGKITDVVRVRNTWADLSADMLELEQTVAQLNKAAVGPAQAITMATKPSENRNVLYVPDQVTKLPAVAAALDGIRSRSAGRLIVDTSETPVVTKEACLLSPRTCDAPLRGGLYFKRPVAGGYCSTAFNARSNSDGKWYMMTAGHCGNEGTVFDVYQPSTGQWHRVGHMHAQRDFVDDDYGIVTINNVAGWRPTRWVRVYGSSDTVADNSYPIYGTSTSPEGTRVCLSGARTGSSCGDVVELNYRGISGGLARAHYCHGPGDSGGAIYSYNRARGIHVGSGNGDDDACHWGLFQGIREAERNLNVHVYTG
ncbi:S1 family peptidase [Microlunatus parietis]